MLAGRSIDCDIGEVMAILCIVPGCINKIRCKSLCRIHYERVRKNGTTELLGPHGRSAEERFQLLSGPVTETGCREWLGHLDKDGYGTIVVNGERIKAHRYAWIRVNGTIPEGLVIDHYKCDNPSCIEIEHIRPTTIRDNTIRSNKTITGINIRKTHCPKGHEYDNIDSNGGRICMICRRETWRRSNAKRKKSKISTHGHWNGTGFNL